MASKGDIEIQANIKSNVGQLSKDVDKATDSTKKLTKETDKAEGGFMGMKNAITGIGRAIKTAGILLFATLLAKLVDVFRTNQKVVDTFSTAMNSLGFAFNDLFKYLSDNYETVTGYLKGLFTDPLGELYKLGQGIQEFFIEKMQGVGTTLKGVWTIMQNLSNPDKFLEGIALISAGTVTAGESIKKTWEDIQNSVTDYIKEIYESGAALTDLENSAKLAGTQLAMLQATRLKEAEDLRKIRDDETKTFAERISANSHLEKIIKQQQKDQLAAASAETKAAKARHEMDKTNIEFKNAYNEALVKEAEIVEATEAQLSEQKTNAVALDKELLASQAEIRAAGQTGRERELAELEENYRLQVDLARRAGLDRKGIDEQYARDKAMIEVESLNTTLSVYSQLSGALSSLFGDNKELAAAAAIIDTYAGANKAIASSPPPLNFIAATAVIAAGMANVRKIYSTNIPGSSGGSDGGGSAFFDTTSSETPAPMMMSGAFDLTGGVAPEPLKAFVVTDEMTNSQNQLANIRRRATI